MASITDLILQQVTASAGSVDIPSALKSKVLNGISDSVLGSLTQTAAKAGGLDQIKSLLTGKTSAASSPITALATNLFTKNVLGNLGLNKAQSTGITALIPTVISKLSNVIQDRDGDGDVDLNDILLSLKGGNAAGKGAGAGILGAAAKGILGSILKR